MEEVVTPHNKLTMDEEQSNAVTPNHPCYRDTRLSWYTERTLTQNIQHHIWDRESGLNRYNRRGCLPQLTHEREFHKCITPRMSIVNVDKPCGYMRKFTPDGSLLVSFATDQNAVEIFQYLGIARVQALLHGITEECMRSADEDIVAVCVRQIIFSELFHLRWRIPLSPESNAMWHLNREFSIFIEDGRYVLLAAHATSIDMYFPRDYYLHYPDLYDHSEIYDYNFYLVDLQRGCVSDKFEMRDFVLLSHNHGVSVHGSTIAIMSRCRQCIDVLELVRGKLVSLYQINRETQPRELVCKNGVYVLGMLSQLKQRCMSYIYKEVVACDDPKKRRKQLRNFYRDFKIYDYMIMFKIQLIDPDTLLIRYEHPVMGQPNINGANSNDGAQSSVDDRAEFKLYVFYSISEDTVLKIYQYDSIELLYMLRNFCDDFRNVRSLQTRRPSSSPSNNIYFRSAFNSAITSLSGGHAEAAARFNPTLPISAQCCTTTCYLDYNLFSYDDRLISALERPKVGGMETICFTDRYTGVMKFRLFLEAVRRSNISSKQLVTFIFHPFEPFIISVQKISTRYVVNFHLYNESTVVVPGARRLNNDIWRHVPVIK